MKFKAFVAFLLLSVIAVLSINVPAQTTAFTYQGSLTDAGSPASGSFQMQFKLFDALSGGTQVGSTIADVPVTASQGVFAAQLDFGSNALSGANRWLEIAVRHNSGESYSTILPRTQLTSSPYSVRTLSAASADLALDSNKLGGVSANGYVTTASAGNSFIKNGALQQTGASFNIDGSGTAGSVNVSGPVSLTGVTPPPMAPAGQGRIYFDSATSKVKVSENGGAFVNLVGAGGVSGSGTVNRLPLWSGGTTTLGDSAITQSVNGIQLPNGVQLAPGAQGNNTAFGSPNGETGMTVAGSTGRADLRFDGSTLKLVAGGAGLVPPPTNGIAINTAGNVGIGTTAPTSKLEIAAQDGLKISGFQPFLTLRDTNGGNKSSFVQGINGDAALLTNSRAALTVKDVSGNVGIGTTAPAHRLSILDGPNWTSNLWKGAIELGYGTAIGWRANPGGQRFGIGPGTGGLYFFRTASDPGTTGSPTNFDLELTDTGNLVQPINNNGLVKAMLYVNADGTIARCYNGITNSSTGNCGFSTNRTIQGSYSIDFGFQVNNRFYALTMIRDSVGIRIGEIIPQVSANGLVIGTFDPANGSAGDSNFMIIVY